MATNSGVGGVDGLTVQERFAQLSRAGLPFNPLGGEEIVGANLTRMLKGMKTFGWKDPRFVTREQADANGWAMKPYAESVDTLVRNVASVAFDKVVLFNAENVLGMPTLATMLAMSNAEISAMGDVGVDVSVDVDDELLIGPARGLVREAGGVGEAIDLRRDNIAARLDFFPRVFDGAGYQAIETNYHGLMSVPTNALGEAEAKDVVIEDLAALRTISAEDECYFAGLLIGSNAKDQHAYQAELVRQAPDIASAVAVALVENNRRISEKENASVRDVGGAADTSVDLEKIKAPAQAGNAVGNGAVAGISASAEDGRFAVLAAYWQNGLHNPKGVALAAEINKAIQANGLSKDREAIARLLAVHANARRLGIEIVSEARYLADPDLKANVAEPRSLLGGALVRDKEGAYRPAGGGVPVLQDKGDSLTLKSKGADAYRGAMELALAKGWTAIELTGKPKMLANAWLEAKMLGLDVVNYAPTDKDMEKYAQRVAEESKLKETAVAAGQKRAVEQGPELVEVRPFVGVDGLTKTATATYTVSQEAVGQQGALDVDGSAVPVAVPAVVRTVVRVGDLVESEVGAVTGVHLGKDAKGVVEKAVEAELGEAVTQVEAVTAPELVLASLAVERDVVTTGAWSGAIVEEVDGFVGQKVGRDPDDIKWHDVSKLVGWVPSLGEIAVITYKDGVGDVQGRGPGLDTGRGR